MSRRRTSIALLMLLPGAVAWAQKEQRAEATERLALPRTVTMEVLEARCIEQARQPAGWME